MSRTESSAASLDETDRAILRVLQENADHSVAEVAERVALPYTPCWRRIQRLERSGIIARRVALLDQRTLGLGVSVLVAVALRRHDEATLKRFERAVQEIDEIMECYAIAGDRDFHLRVVVPDVEAYDRLLKAKLVHLPGAASVSSSFALSCVKYTTKLPI
jgi:Lrp/AsnC family transcriptional regulator